MCAAERISKCEANECWTKTPPVISKDNQAATGPSQNLSIGLYQVGAILCSAMPAHCERMLFWDEILARLLYLSDEGNIVCACVVQELDDSRQGLALRREARQGRYELNQAIVKTSCGN